jgi:transcriptional regulator with XRE-family HTH domain
MTTTQSQSTPRSENGRAEDTETRRRRELGEFLRLRRARVQPNEVDLPPGGPRRTPGLRREEVAVLAGVGVTWYAWLEQGRPINPSESVLASIGRALRLTYPETDHLFILAGLRPEVTGGITHMPHVADMLRRLVEQQEPAVAFLMDARWDLVCWNRTAGALLGFDWAAPDQLNVARQMLVADGYGRLLEDKDRHARGMVAELRLASGRLVGDDQFRELIAGLRRDRQEVDEWWELGEVRCRMDTEKVFRHPDVGVIEVDEAVLRPASAPDLQLTMLVPRSGSEERLRRLVAASPLPTTKAPEPG